jgi:hypothetical protein
MSAAATAAGYLYASGRLRGRGSKEGDDKGADRQNQRGAERPRIRVAALPETAVEPREAAPARPKREPTIQYRTRRWRPDAP